MASEAKVLAALAVGFSSVALLACVFLVPLLYRDIASLHEGIMTEMGEFQVGPSRCSMISSLGGSAFQIMTDDLWKNMLSMMEMRKAAGKGYGSFSITKFPELFRVKRQGSNCRKRTTAFCPYLGVTLLSF